MSDIYDNFDELFPALKRTNEVQAKAAKKKPRKKSTGPSETEIQESILDYLQQRPDVIFAFRCNSGKVQVLPNYSGGRPYWLQLAPKGTADIIGMMDNGRFLAVEVKKGKAQPSKEQKEFINLIRKGGGVAIVANGVERCQDRLDTELRHIDETGTILPF